MADEEAERLNKEFLAKAAYYKWLSQHHNRSAMAPVLHATNPSNGKPTQVGTSPSGEPTTVAEV